MRPVSFHPNERLFASADPGVDPLPILPVIWPSGHSGLISCWELSADELAEVLVTGRVYLALWGPPHPPVLVTAYLSDIVGDGSAVLSAEAGKPD